MVLASKGFHVDNDGSEEWPSLSTWIPLFFFLTLPKTNTPPKNYQNRGETSQK